jgi:hypothetical protein
MNKAKALPIKFSEKMIQAHLWANRTTFTDLIDFEVKAEIIETFPADEDAAPEVILWNIVAARVNDYIEELRSLVVVAQSVELEKKDNATITMDLLGRFLGNPGLAIIELKKGNRTEREAFTELLGYANHVATIFPGSTRDDIALVLLAPMQARIAREAYLQSLLFDNRKVVVLQVSFRDPNDIGTLRLTPWLPSREDVRLLSRASFDPRNLSVSKVVWEPVPGWWNKELDGEKNVDPDDRLKRQFDHVAALAAQRMEQKGIHGFCYCLQSWPEVNMPLPNALVVVGINPVAVGSALWLLEDGVSPSELPGPDVFCIDFEELFPSLSLPAHLIVDGERWEPGTSLADTFTHDLYATWDANLFRVARATVEQAVKPINGARIQIDQGHMTWDDYVEETLEDTACFNFAVFPTGLVRELFHNVHETDMDVIAHLGGIEHPLHGDYGAGIGIEALVSHGVFRAFLERMSWLHQAE